MALDTAIVAIAASSFAQYPLVNAQANRVLNLYSARHYDADNTLYQGFTNRTGIRVNLVEAPADKLIER
ncbi:MAG: Fe(3+) ABC transporter substrate-binding protein, partial [Leptodesmis sp.]